MGQENLQEDMMDNGLGLAFLDKNDNFVQAKCACDGFLYPSNFQNFVVLDEGVKFIMNTYQVGAGALGNPEAIIPWSELKPYLNPNFILK
ncbi:MAG: RsiV family protein [Candidatus Paceibacterota bacterium]